jgi:hypothetical protein
MSCDIPVAEDCGFTGITAMSVKKPTLFGRRQPSSMRQSI